MERKKTAYIILLVIGLVILVLSVAADPLGIGGTDTTFGWKQIAGTVVGAIATLAGLILTLKE